MDCKEVIPLLSPFHDGELAADKHRAVADHVASCADCALKLEAIRRLSDLVEATPSPEAPAALVARVERAINQRASFWLWLQHSRPQRNAAAALAFVAAIFVVGLAIWRFTTGTSHSHVEMAQAFGEFLAAYERGDESAVELLPRKYQGTLVNETTATSALKRETVARSIVLTKHQATKRYLLKMPCCDCVETVYTCEGITSLVLFEHEKEQSEWFDHRPMIRSECQGKACCMVQLKGTLAATWPVDGGFVTVVGVRDVAELSSLVDELQPH